MNNDIFYSLVFIEFMDEYQELFVNLIVKTIIVVTQELEISNDEIEELLKGTGERVINAMEKIEQIDL